MSTRRHEQTIRVLIETYCRDRHETDGGLCEDCAALLDYARQRLARCPYMPKKPACSRCPTHCYRPTMRQRVREVMRYAGPRLGRRHPLLALGHLLDMRRRGSQRQVNGRSEP